LKRYKQDEIDELADILKRDGIISVPTDTVYGLCVSMNSQKAHDKLIEAKNRPYNKLFPVMCADIEQIKSIALVSEREEKLINHFMPGPVTLILKVKPEIPDYITNGNDTIAIRMATSEALKKLIIKTESPIFMSSANISGEPPCSTLDEIEKAFPLLDGMMEGNITFGEASTIIDCTSGQIQILRLGPVSMREIMNVLEKY